ncbi:hypothetical protein J2W28_001061 [Variovorax boronicumulans]|uniref:hypothetical protein n=1 Tax=Variovorax boronicumulans TaxID=436515 RepID=UPI00278837B7|nr:hypothetical protein [Variovorax boronicumulans]MDP9992033.1 hypothetical protein [Variovorax boronicumulans]MDQ0001928.1 hypothetical protein [Variovorax boronicumulans]
MSARPFYTTVYHRIDWRLADAFRPQPGWGSRVFTAPVAALGGMSESALLQAAHQIAPEGHRLTSLSIHPADGADRIIWSTPPDARMASPELNQARDDALKEVF